MTRKTIGAYGVVRRLFNVSVAALGLLFASTVAAQAEPTRLLILGDSLAAGYGLPRDAGFIAQLTRALKAAGRDVVLLDGGVSGDTSAGGRARINWSLANNPTHALVELGANDALRGVDPASTHANLKAILAALQQAGVPVLLAGMRAPRNFGDDYADQFDAIYPNLAGEGAFNGFVALYPFFLDGVALRPALNQADGIHPNKKGVAVIVRRILPDILALLERKAAQ